MVTERISAVLDLSHPSKIATRWFCTDLLERLYLKEPRASARRHRRSRHLRPATSPRRRRAALRRDERPRAPGGAYAAWAPVSSRNAPGKPAQGHPHAGRGAHHAADARRPRDVQAIDEWCACTPTKTARPELLRKVSVRAPRTALVYWRTQQRGYCCRWPRGSVSERVSAARSAGRRP